MTDVEVRMERIRGELRTRVGAEVIEARQPPRRVLCAPAKRG